MFSLSVCNQQPRLWSEDRGKGADLYLYIFLEVRISLTGYCHLLLFSLGSFDVSGSEIYLLSTLKADQE